jgi:hypothetical protein
MGGMFNSETLLRELAEAEQQLFAMGFDSMSDAVEQALALFKIADLDDLQRKLRESPPK